METFRKIVCPAMKKPFPGLPSPNATRSPFHPLEIRPLPIPNEECKSYKTCGASSVKPLFQPLPKPAAHIETTSKPLSTPLPQPGGGIETTVEAFPKPLPKPHEESISPAPKRRRIEHLAQAHQDALRHLNSSAADMHQQLDLCAPAAVEAGNAAQLGKVTESVSGIMQVLPQLANAFDEVVAVACEMSMDDASTVAQAMARAAEAEERMNAAELARREAEEQLRAGTALQTEEHLQAVRRAEQAEEQLAVAERARKEAEEKLGALEAKNRIQDCEQTMHRGAQAADNLTWAFVANKEPQDCTWALCRQVHAEESLAAAEHSRMEAGEMPRCSF